MSYVVYDHSLQRTGFRPRLRNPYGAAHGLSGKIATRIDPQYPFTARGGWKLHGLGQGTPGQVPDGSNLVYQGQWTTLGSVGSSGITPVLQQVQSLMAANGLTITGEQVTSANFAAKSGLTSGTPFQITLQVSVNTGMGGYGQASDVASIINGYVYQVTGIMGIGSVTSVNSGSTGALAPLPPVGSTGNLSNNPNDPNCQAGLAYDSSGNICPNMAGALAWLESNALWIGLGLAAVVVLPKLL